MTVAAQIPNHKGVQPKSTTTKRTTTKAVAKVAKPEEKSDFTLAKAKQHTEKIKKGATATWEQINEAYKGRIWIALGHKSWDEYCDKEFDGVPLALPREKKRQAIESLASAGVSSRAIAAATGVSQSTAARQVKDALAPKPSGESNDSPPKDVIDVPPEDVTEVESEEQTELRVVGQDGKSYPANQPAREPVVINIVSSARTIAKDLESVRIRLDSLFSRDDYEDNKVDVQGTLETTVSDLLDTIVEEFADLVRERAPQGEPEPAV